MSKITNLIKKNKTFFIVLAAGLLIRLIIAPFTSYAYDIGAFVKNLDLFYIADFNPLYWWGYGSFYLFILMLFYPFKLIINDIGVDNLYLTQLIIKIPFILADLGIACILYRISKCLTKNRNTSLTIFALWFLNPFVIFISSVHGMFDAIPTFFVILAIYYLLVNKIYKSYIFLAIAAGIKLFAVFLIPFFILYFLRKSSIKKHLLALFIALITGLLNFAPLFIDSVVRASFIRSLFWHTSGVLSQVSNLSIWRIFFDAEVVYILPTFLISKLFFLFFLPLYLFFIIKILLNVKDKKFDFHKLIIYLTCVLCLLLPFNTANVIQYTIWFFPFLLIISLIYKKINILLVNVLLLLVFISFSLDNNLFSYFYNAVPYLERLPWTFLNESMGTLLGFIYALLSIYLTSEIIRGSSESSEIAIKKELTGYNFVRKNYLTLFIFVGVIIFVLTFVPYKYLRLPPTEFKDRDVYFNYINEPTEVKQEGNSLVYTFDLEHLDLFNDRIWQNSYSVLFTEDQLAEVIDPKEEIEIDDKIRAVFVEASRELDPEDINLRKKPEVDEQAITKLEKDIAIDHEIYINNQTLAYNFSTKRFHNGSVYPYPFDGRKYLEAIDINDHQNYLNCETEVVISYPETPSSEEELPKLYIETQIEIERVSPWWQENRIIIYLVSIITVSLSLILLWVLVKPCLYNQGKQA